jgi:nicotinamide mononucleotide transporter
MRGNHGTIIQHNVTSQLLILLVLKFGYLTNTTYGYIKWTKYINEHPEVLEEKTIF